MVFGFIEVNKVIADFIVLPYFSVLRYLFMI